ncbi:hypothetical protein DFJ74DRAFT_640175 [Hyaloraphidium curvatum]|nr:hypothetical protein DFJ74DRAFT_640175 [Hyaloraphidium curvatum]
MGRVLVGWLRALLTAIGILELEHKKLALLSDQHLIVGKVDYATPEWNAALADIRSVRRTDTDITVVYRNLAGTELKAILHGLKAKPADVSSFFSKLELSISQLEISRRRE